MRDLVIVMMSALFSGVPQYQCTWHVTSVKAKHAESRIKWANDRGEGEAEEQIGNMIPYTRVSVCSVTSTCEAPASMSFNPLINKPVANHPKYPEPLFLHTQQHGPPVLPN